MPRYWWNSRHDYLGPNAEIKWRYHPRLPLKFQLHHLKPMLPDEAFIYCICIWPNKASYAAHLHGSCLWCGIFISTVHAGHPFVFVHYTAASQVLGEYKDIPFRSLRWVYAFRGGRWLKRLINYRFSQKWGIYSWWRRLSPWKRNAACIGSERGRWKLQIQLVFGSMAAQCRTTRSGTY